MKNEEIENMKFENLKGLKVCVGKDTKNEEVWIDICETPHLLISGRIGSRKNNAYTFNFS